MTLQKNSLRARSYSVPPARRLISITAYVCESGRGDFASAAWYAVFIHIPCSLSHFQDRQIL